MGNEEINFPIHTLIWSPCTRILTLYILETPLEMGTFANSEDPDQMQHNAAFHQGLHCLLRLKQSSGTEKHHKLENSTCVTLKYTMDSPILIVLICVEKTIGIQRVNGPRKCTLNENFSHLF